VTSPLLLSLSYHEQIRNEKRKKEKTKEENEKLTEEKNGERSILLTV
jgi:hypothetical protein